MVVCRFVVVVLVVVWVGCRLVVLFFIGIWLLMVFGFDIDLFCLFGVFVFDLLVLVWMVWMYLLLVCWFGFWWC